MANVGPSPSAVQRGQLELQPVTLREANAFVRAHHRTHNPARGCVFCIAVNDGSEVVGVVIVGRPVARSLQDGWTAEVVRSCTDGTRNANSMLYGAAWRAARAVGYRRLITYTLVSEGGASLRGAGWQVVGERKGHRSWDCAARPRVDQDRLTGQKLLWEVTA